MTLVATRKLLAYALLAVAGLFLAVIAGSPDLAVLALPFAAIVAFTTHHELSAVSVDVSLERQRALAGDVLAAEIAIRSGASVIADLTLAPRDGLVVRDPTCLRHVRLRGGNIVRKPVEFVCRRWGRYDAGRVVVRATDPFGMLVWQTASQQSSELRVYPRPEHLARPLQPRATHRFVGDFVSREKGDGLEFADIRAYTPGDRVKRINWRTSGRRRSLYVNEYHPERNADLVLFLDTFSELHAQRNLLEQAVSAAVALADLHLRRRDRVGLVCYGGTLRWLTPASGRRHLYQIVEALLEVESYETTAERDVSVLPRALLPPHALVFAITPLLDERALSALLSLKRAGADLVVVEVAAPLPAAEATDDIDDLARRLWALRRRAIRARCKSAGAPVIEWQDGTPLQAALELTREWRRASAHARV